MFIGKQLPNGKKSLKFSTCKETHH